jgi:hypothetical protein
MQLVFEPMAAGTVPVMEPPPPPAGEQPILLTFEDFVAQHCPTPVSTSPNYPTTYHAFNTIIYLFNISFQTCRELIDPPLVVVPVMATLPSHGARSLQSTEEVAVTVLPVALLVVVTTLALAVLAVPNLVVDLLTLKPLGDGGHDLSFMHSYYVVQTYVVLFRRMFY